MFKLLVLFLCFRLVWSAPVSTSYNIFDDLGNFFGIKLNHRDLDSLGHYVGHRVTNWAIDGDLSSFYNSKLQIRAPKPAPTLTDKKPKDGGYVVADPKTGTVVIHYDARMMPDHVDNTVNFANPVDSARQYKDGSDNADTRGERMLDEKGHQAKSTEGMANDEVRPFGRAQILTE